MSDPTTPERQWAETVLRRVAGEPDPRHDIAEAALALATLGEKHVDIVHYQRHLLDIGEQVAESGDARAPERMVAALNQSLVERMGYRGDGDTYDDLQNANLIRVIDRRRGMPVTLGILYLHAARSQGWRMVGLNFPRRFLVRLETDGKRIIIDPFGGGGTPDAAELRRMLKASGAEDDQLNPDYYAPVSDRSILLRLQNNLRYRLIGADRFDEAARVVETMLMFAPEEADLWRDIALLHAHLGHYDQAVDAIERFLPRADNDRDRHRMAALKQRLKGKRH
jgi:regulator of sirC expression with transglutaminase-like and TPR domain